MPTVGGAGVAGELGWRCDGGEIESSEEKGIRVESRRGFWEQGEIFYINL
jgi:hypothetical protein